MLSFVTKQMLNDCYLTWIINIVNTSPPSNINWHKSLVFSGVILSENLAPKAHASKDQESYISCPDESGIITSGYSSAGEEQRSENQFPLS